MAGRSNKSLTGRIIRGAMLLIAALLLFSAAAGYAPFMRCPTLDAQSAAALEVRADQMQRDVDTGDRAMLLESGLDGLDERLRLISRAEREIVIVTYECHDGESTRDILAAALERADAGVRVRFLVDGIAGRLDHMTGELFCAAATHPHVEIRFYNLISHLTPWKHMGRMHDKYVIVDDTAYILGGRNMFDKFLGDYPARTRSLDREVLVYNAGGRADSSLYALRDYFEKLWDGPDTRAFDARRRIGDARRSAIYAELSARLKELRESRPELFIPCDYASATVETRGIWLVSNPTTIYAKQPTVFYQLIALMRRAQGGIVLHSPYAVLNREMHEALSAVAGQAPVTLMINAVENGANVVASSDYLFHRSELLSTGVRLMEYAGGQSYHGKAAAIGDELSAIGSFNLDIRSAYVDTELMLIIRGRDFNALLREDMEALHAECRSVNADGSIEVPEGLTIPRLPLWKRAALYALGGVMQLVRNLV